MKITKEGIYRDKDGIELHVINVTKKLNCSPYFRAYHKGGWYNVNEEPDNAPFGAVEWEMVEFVRELVVDKK